MIQLTRADQNPVLSPTEDIEWASEAVFNPGVIIHNDKVHLLYRAIGEYDTYISRIGLATSTDGIQFSFGNKEPVISPEDDYDKWACEDPRITKIDDTYYITYVALATRIREGGKPTYDIIHNLNSQTALVTTKDFVTFERHGIITPDESDNRDVVIFPEKINNRFVILHRPHRWCKEWFKDPRSKDIEVNIPVPLEELPEKPSTWLSYATDLKNWTEHALLMPPTHEHDAKVGPGAPPIRTEHGWLVMYHHVEKDEKDRIVYTAKAALLDLVDPSKVIAKIPYPILVPEASYEVRGDVDNVVFPTGVYVKDGVLFVYYGTADKYIGLATIQMTELLDELLRHPSA